MKKVPVLCMVILLLLSAAVRAFGSDCSLSEARRVVDLSARSGPYSQKPPQKPDSPDNIICADFQRFGLMLVLHGTPPLHPSWTVYQQAKGGRWRDVDDLNAPGKVGAVKILPNGDLLEDTGVGFSTQRRWNGARFKTVAVSPPPDASRCSVLQAQELDALSGAPAVYYASIDKSTFSCRDFTKYGIMFFLESEAEDGSGYTVAAYQTNTEKNGWRRVGSFGAGGQEAFRVLHNGDITVQGDLERHVWHWNGRRFVLIRKSRMVSYWIRDRFARTVVSNGDRLPGLSGCSVRGARTALSANRESIEHMEAVSEARAAGAEPNSAEWKRFMTGEGEYDPLKGQLMRGVGRPPYIGHLLCGDFTGDGGTEMAFDLPRFPCMACDPWFLFRKSATGWGLLAETDQIVCMLPRPHGLTVIRSTNRGRGMVRQQLHWNGTEFIPMKPQYLAHDVSDTKACHEQEQLVRGAISAE